MCSRKIFWRKWRPGTTQRIFYLYLEPADQLPADGSAKELGEDYARRIARVLSLESPPRIFLISARQPGAFDLPELSRLLSREKTADSLAESRDLANRRHQRTLLSWLLERDLPGRAERLNRLDNEAAELLSERLGVPLVETTIPAITEFRLPDGHDR